MANFTALKTAINNAIRTNGNEEITGAVLQVILDAMVETLGDSAINNLETALATEVTNRENAVGGVAGDLAAEALARANKDNQLDGRINQEEYNRAVADAALSRTVDQGFQTLNSQMTALNEAISALNAAYQNGYLYGGIATPSSSPSNSKCFYIALQGGTYTNFGGVGVVEGINIIKNDSGWKVEHIYDQTTLLNEFYLLRQQVIRALASVDPIVIQGDVTNAPDEEDLTSNAQHLLKFKDRVYSPLNFSGLGMKILRKNILPLNDSVAFNGFLEGVTAEETLAGSPELIFWDRMNTRFVGSKDGVYYVAWTDDDNYVPVSTSLVYMYDGTPYKWDGSNFSVDEDEVPNLQNCLTQDMINEANTIYIIRYDYTLKEDITIPVNCVLKFDGGSISGEHTITGANTGIQAGLVKIFSTDVILAGTWNVAEAYPEWFGAVGDGETNDTEPIQKAIDFLFTISGGVVALKSASYLVDTLYMKSRVSLIGVGASASELKSNSASTSVSIPTDCAINEIAHLSFNGNNIGNTAISIEPDDTNTSGGTATIIHGYNEEGVLNHAMTNIHDVSITLFKGTAVFVGLNRVLVQINNIQIISCDGIGLDVRGYDSYFSNINICVKDTGLWVGGNNNKFNTFKIYFCSDVNSDINSGAGLYCYGVRNQFENIECQDCYYHGFIIAGTENIFINCLSDSNGYRSATAASRYGFFVKQNGGFLIGCTHLKRGSANQMGYGLYANETAIASCSFDVHIQDDSVVKKANFDNYFSIKYKEYAGYKKGLNGNVKITDLEVGIYDTLGTALNLQNDNNETVLTLPAYTTLKVRKQGSLDFSEYFRRSSRILYIWKQGYTFITFNGIGSNVNLSGTFAERPLSGIPIGFGYFCTNRQTPEGQTNGIMLYYTGSGWVDALGRAFT